jgi:hypothetical protein
MKFIRASIAVMYRQQVVLEVISATASISVVERRGDGMRAGTRHALVNHLVAKDVYIYPFTRDEPDESPLFELRKRQGSYEGRLTLDTALLIWIRGC